ncbi:hypothetical protein HY68_37105 [Streptomyces sp. AcH 505]|nr:hypothetical protein HY68_37105 [Streptomyces sp. AcH 505]
MPSGGHREQESCLPNGSYATMAAVEDRLSPVLDGLTIQLDDCGGGPTSTAPDRSLASER